MSPGDVQPSSRAAGEHPGQVRRQPRSSSSWKRRGIELISHLAALGAIVGTAVLLFGCSRLVEPEAPRPAPPSASHKVPNAPAPDNTIKEAPADLGQKPAPPSPAPSKN